MLFKHRSGLISSVLAGVFVVASAANAQKSEDTVRIPLTGPISVISSYYNLNRENASLFSRVAYDTLIYYDHLVGDFQPLLAKSWKRISPTVLEFELHDDVKFHNGNTFDADDVVYTMKWITEKNNKIQVPYSYTWIANAEKLGTHKVRITSKKQFAPDLLVLATQASILDAETHGLLKDKIDQGRAPNGTGPYKIAQVDTNAGVVAVRNESFAHGPDWMKGKAKTIHGLPIPTVDTQIAQLLTGNIDLIKDATADQIKELARDERFKVTSLPALFMSFIQFDSINRSGRKELQDVRVRQALVKAIDRDAIIRTMVPGGKAADAMDALCFRSMLGCDVSVPPLPYDPSGAKALLAEAGYPNGFEIELTARAETRDAATAVAGFWRKIGVKASVQFVPHGVYKKKQRAGELQAYFGPRPFSMEDASYAMNVVTGSELQDYWNDPLLEKAAREGVEEVDPAKRRAIYREAFNRINEQAYLVPFSSIPSTVIHDKDLDIVSSRERPFDFNITNFDWN